MNRVFRGLSSAKYCYLKKLEKAVNIVESYISEPAALLFDRCNFILVLVRALREASATSFDFHTLVVFTMLFDYTYFIYSELIISIMYLNFYNVSECLFD